MHITRTKVGLPRDRAVLSSLQEDVVTSGCHVFTALNWGPIRKGTALTGRKQPV